MMIKKILLFICLSIISCTITFFLTLYNYQNINLYNNQLFFTVVNNALDNPINKVDVVEILSGEDEQLANFERFGYRVDDLFLTNHMKDIFIHNVFLNIVIVESIVIVAFSAIIVFKKNQKHQYDQIIEYTKSLDNGNYKYDINDASKSDLSYLKDELYKITIALKEQAMQTKLEKIAIKDNIVDVSHQLKTPVTSSLILIDNIIDDENMDKELQTEFLQDIKYQIENMEILILNLLKLSKFDADVIRFTKTPVTVNELLKDVRDKMDSLLKHKGCKLNISDSQALMNVDTTWQVEALSNIVKNAIEHSDSGGKIDIQVTDTNFYVEICIRDYGRGIDETELKKIFKRFYKGADANINNIGVGLNLARAIITKDNGIIDVTSTINKGTAFYIKYFKN